MGIQRSRRIYPQMEGIWKTNPHDPVDQFVEGDSRGLTKRELFAQLGGETSHLDNGNVPIQTEACSKKLAVFPTDPEEGE